MQGHDRNPHDWGIWCYNRARTSIKSCNAEANQSNTLWAGNRVHRVKCGPTHQLVPLHVKFTCSSWTDYYTLLFSFTWITFSTYIVFQDTAPFDSMMFYTYCSSVDMISYLPPVQFVYVMSPPVVSLSSKPNLWAPDCSLFSLFTFLISFETGVSWCAGSNWEAGPHT